MFKRNAKVLLTMILSFLFQCLEDDDFVYENCFSNPKLCDKGFSFSIFYYPKYKESAVEILNDQNISNFDREYIVSTGPDNGTPGFAIYRQGGYMGAVVSTGEETYDVEVFKLPENNTWTNVAIR